MQFNQDFIRLIAEKVIKANDEYQGGVWTLPVGLSNRHVHLSKQDLFTLFGSGYVLHEDRPLSQKGEFAAKESVVLSGPKGALTGVRVVGPIRKSTQVELLMSDARTLGIHLSLADSGDETQGAAVTLTGPCGSVQCQSGVMATRRHIHLEPATALRMGLSDGQTVSVRVGGIRALTFFEVRIRVHETFVNELHIDIEEANAALLRNGDKVVVMLDGQ